MQSTNAGLAIEARDVVRTYGSKGGQVVEALRGVNLEVPSGELFGLLGPNGAGKTTMIKILTTLLLPTGGAARVAGYDVVRQAQSVRRSINMVSGGENAGYGLLTVRENLWMFSQFYGVPDKVAHQRITEGLKAIDMSDLDKRKVWSLSTGMKQKMNFVRGLINDPTVLFLDEPTLGLDVESVRLLRRFVKNWVREGQGKTVLLTTHYMHEADELCDRVAIIDHGQVVACDSPAGLKQMLQGASHFEVLLMGMPEGQNHYDAIPGVKSASAAHRSGGVELKVVLDEDAAIANIVTHAAKAGGHVATLRKVEPTLEDVFVHLVGRRLNEDEDE